MPPLGNRYLRARLLSQVKNVKRDAIERGIEDYQSDIREEEKYLRKAQATLQAFRTDKPQFVVDYISNLTQQKVDSQHRSSGQ